MGKRIFILVLQFLVLSSASHASSVIEINERQSRYSLGPYLDVLEDPAGDLTIEEVTRPPAAGRFIPHQGDTPNLGFSKSAFWLRIDVSNGSERIQELILQQFCSWIDSMELYIIRRDGGMEQRRAGEKYPFQQREIISPHFLFALALEPGESARLYMRVKSEDPLQLPMALWKRKSFDIHNLGMTQYFGAVFGCLLTIFFYNLFLFFSLRDFNYLYYVLYIFSLLLMIFTYTGNSYQYLWPDSPRFQDWVVFPSGFLAMFLAVFFAKGFLSTKTNLPGAHRFLTAFQAFCLFIPAAGAVMGGIYFVSMACVASAMVFPFMQAYIGVMAYRNNIRSARFFVLAWSFSMIGILYTMVMVTGLFPSSQASRHSMEAGLVIDAIMLSFALADKIKILRADKEHAEKRSMALLAASKEELEERVSERTAELKQAKEKAEEANRFKEKFVSLVSHDLRAPLGAIIGLLGNAMDSPREAGGKMDDFMRRSMNAAERLLSLIDHLLNISRLRSGKIVPVKTIFPAREAVAEAMASLEQLALRKGIALENRTPEDSILVADRSLAGQLFANLISNAIKFSHPGGRVEVFSGGVESGLIFFQDNGVGIKNDLLPHIFNAEVKTSTTGTAGERGTGLGLPYCREIMEAHGGSISVWSSEGEGARFQVAFPRPDRLVMLLDDQEAHRGMMKSALSSAVKVDFLETDDGAEALRMLGFIRPCFIITDVAMPKMNGMIFLAKLKEDENLRRIPVVMASTGENSGEDITNLRARAKSLGAADFVVKPVSAHDLIQRTLRLFDST